MYSDNERMESSDLIRIELKSLRDEILQVKRCQHMFLIFEVTTTGALLSFIVGTVARVNYEGITFGHLLLCLIPVIVVIPSLLIILDKGITCNRICAFFKILERTTMKKEERRLNFGGWENSCSKFRSRQNELKTPGGRGRRFMTQGPNVFYQLVFWISVGLMVICMLVMVLFAQQTDWVCFKGGQLVYQMVLLIIIFCALGGMLALAWRACQRLLVGRHSIEAMAELWEKIMMSEE